MLATATPSPRHSLLYDTPPRSHANSSLGRTTARRREPSVAMSSRESSPGFEIIGWTDPTRSSPVLPAAEPVRTPTPTPTPPPEEPVPDLEPTQPQPLTRTSSGVATRARRVATPISWAASASASAPASQSPPLEQQGATRLVDPSNPGIPFDQMALLAKGRTRPKNAKDKHPWPFSTIQCALVVDGKLCDALLITDNALAKHLHNHVDRALAAKERNEEHSYTLNHVKTTVDDLSARVEQYLAHAAEMVCIFKDCPSQRVTKPESHYRAGERNGTHPLPPYDKGMLRDQPKPLPVIKLDAVNTPLLILPQEPVPTYMFTTEPVEPHKGGPGNMGNTLADLEHSIITRRDPDAPFRGIGPGALHQFDSSDFLARLEGWQSDSDDEEEEVDDGTTEIQSVGTPLAFGGSQIVPMHQRALSVISDASFAPTSTMSGVGPSQRHTRLRPTRSMQSQPTQMSPVSSPRINHTYSLRPPVPLDLKPAISGVQPRAVRQKPGLDQLPIPKPKCTAEGRAPLKVIKGQTHIRLVELPIDYVLRRCAEAEARQEKDAVAAAVTKSGTVTTAVEMSDSATTDTDQVDKGKGKMPAADIDTELMPAPTAIPVRLKSLTSLDNDNAVAGPSNISTGTLPLRGTKRMRDYEASQARQRAEEEEKCIDLATSRYAYKKTGMRYGHAFLIIKTAAVETVREMLQEEERAQGNGQGSVKEEVTVGGTQPAVNREGGGSADMSAGGQADVVMMNGAGDKGGSADVDVEERPAKMSRVGSAADRAAVMSSVSDTPKNGTPSSD